jgi:hypothetical protein
MQKNDEVLNLNHPDCYEKLSLEKKQAIVEWIRQKFVKASRVYNSSSYGLKHYYERETGVYVTNGEFKGAMLAAGFVPKKDTELNWYFKIKNKRKH